MTKIRKKFKASEWGVTEEEQLAVKLITQLEEERKAQHLTQKQLADLANISQGQLSRIENLESIPSFETVVNLATALKKSLQLV